MPKRSVTEIGESPSTSKKRPQCFRTEYSEEFPFIKKGKVCETNAYCEICNCEFKIKYGGKNDITKHNACKKHVELAKLAQESKKVDTFFSSTKSKKSNDVIKAEVMLVDLVTELNLPLASLDNFSKAFKLMFKEDKVAKQFQCGRSKGTAIVKEIAAKSTMSLALRMKSSPFTISTDGSNDLGSCKLFPIVVRTVNPDLQLVTSDLLSVPVCEGPATGENIVQLLDAEFSVHKIPWTNCISLGADNAPVMSGKDKGVYGLLLKKNPKLFMSGCVCHLIHKAAEKGASCLPISVDQLLIDVYYYLDKSSKRQAAFKDMQILHEVNENKILKHVNTRWLSIKRCLPRILDNWEPLLSFFKNQEKVTKDASKERVTRLRKIFSSPTNRLICLFLTDALQPFDEINTELQSDAPKIHLVRRRLEKLLRSLLIRFVKPSAMINKSLTEVKIDVQENLKENVDLHIGQEALDFISRREEVHLRDERLAIFYVL